MRKWIANRELCYSLKGTDARNELVVRISEPYLVEKGTVNFDFAPGTAGCTVEFIGLKEGYVFEKGNLHEVYGADSMQALQIAVDIEPALKRLSKKYNIYFPTGELYFDPDDND
jgi:hypothetical protein